jgi:hypothetical protein
MVEWAVTSDGIRAQGCDAEVIVETADWRPGGRVAALPRPVDAAVSGTVCALTLPQGRVTRGDATDGGDGPFPPGRQHLVVNADIETVVSFEGPARLAGRILTFPERSAVTVGFRQRETALPTLTVAPTPDGVATALTHLSSAHRTTGPERSHPAYRAHPPRVAFGEPAVPPVVRDATPETGIELHLPARFECLYPAAPLAYYLGASVHVGSDEPRVRLPALGEERLLPQEPDYEDGVAELLQRVFYLDCLVRGCDLETPVTPTELDLPDGLDETAPDVRLRAAFDVSPTAVAPHLPQWHLATYVDPVADHARALPYLCDRLSLVYRPESSALDGKELLKRSLDDFFRGDVASVEMLEPRLRTGQLHAWLAEGTPIDAFKTSVRANENRLAHRASRREDITVTVVLNDPEMENERQVADIYRERAADLPIEVTVHESLTRRELATVFETPTDFVHYVGHCEVGGLKCADGYLPTETLEACRAKTFFLNACGSYYEGMALVEGGAVAGGITLTSVLNDQAVTVGTAFARLLIHGFGIERALQLARRQIMMGKDYAVVGDGTFSLAPTSGDPTVLWLDGRPDGRFDAAYEVMSSQSMGRRYRTPLSESSHLYGTTVEVTLDRDALVEVLDSNAFPVVFDGELRWSFPLADVLRGA